MLRGLYVHGDQKGGGAMKGVAVPTMETELGTERLCTWCGEWWPQDEEFWYFQKGGAVMGRCKACWSDWKRQERRRKAA